MWAIVVSNNRLKGELERVNIFIYFETFQGLRKHCANF